MELNKMLYEMKEEEMNVSSDEAPSQEGMKVLINSETSFKGRITKPAVVSFKYKDLASTLSDATGLTINREKAKAIFNALKRTMGL